MELTNDFRVSVPIDQAWSVLTDLERIAPCMPGAQLQEVEGEEYRGIVKVKVGPITAQYKGTAHFVEQDVAAHRAVLKAEGRDTRGQGNASATVTAVLSADGDGTAVSIVTDLAITGKVAQFGRGVLADVSAKLLDQFVQRLEADVLSSGGKADPAPGGKVDSASPADAGSQAPPAAPAEGGSGSEPSANGIDQPKGAARASTGRAARSGSSRAAAGKTGPAPEAGTPEAGTPAGAKTPAPAGTDKTSGTEPQAGAGPAAGTDTASAPSHDAKSGRPALRTIHSPDPEPVDLLDAAGGSVAKRLGFVAAIGLIISTIVWAYRRKR
jgi:carbon monoxide dehydrogenase subunit G